MLFFFSIFFFYTSINAQTNKTDDCNKIVNQIDKLLLYKDKSPKQLRSLMTDLKSCLGEENQVYKQLNIRVNGNLLPIDIKLVKSDIYNKRFNEGIRKIPKLKLQYQLNKLLPSSDPVYVAYENFKSDFGQDGLMLVIATNEPDFYKEDKYPFLQNKTPIDIYNNLIRLYEDSNFRKNYAELCKDWVIRNHSRN